MRIISGKHKGRRIRAPKKLPARPTTDMAKEGLFNILNNRFYYEMDMTISPIKSDVFKYLAKGAIKSDIIFADPPYDISIEEFASLPEIIFKNELLLPEGLLIIEHSERTNLSELPNFSSKRRYGGSVFSFFEKHS